MLGNNLHGSCDALLSTPDMHPMSVVQSVFMLPGELSITERLRTEKVKSRLYVRLFLDKVV